MGIETILEYLNAVPVRATYGAVADVLGVRPQVVPRLLGTRRPEASWIVNGSTGEPTGYSPEQVDPRLAGTPVIRSGDELRRGLERGHAATTAPLPLPLPEVASTAEGVAGRETPETGVAGRETPETADLAMSSDTKWIIGTIVPAVLLVAALLSAQIASVSGSLNARIDDVNARIDDKRADLAAQIAGVDTRVDGVRNELGEEIAALRGDVSSIAARLGAVELALGPMDPSLVPAPAGSEQASDPAAPAVSDPDAEPEAPPKPAEPVSNPDAQPEAPPEPAEPVVTPDAQPETPSEPAEPVVSPDPPGA